MWVRLDDGFADHPKVIAVGPVGAWLYVAGLCYANRYLTNGFIPEGQVERLLSNALSNANGAKSRETLKAQNVESFTKKHPLVTKLCAAELWKPASVKGAKGYQIHDFLKYQPSRTQVLRRRKKTNDRVAKWRNKATTEERDA